MINLWAKLDRVVMGKPAHRDNVASISLSKRRALPLLGADGISSVAYAPDEIILMLSIAGTSALVFSPLVAFGIAVILLIVVGTYRYNLAQIAERGDYLLVRHRLGKFPALVQGASSMVDYLLTVAVSVASATTYLLMLFPQGQAYSTWIAISLVIIITGLCLHGLRLMGKLSQIPTYSFLALLTLTVITGLFQHFTGTLAAAESSTYTVLPQTPEGQVLTGAGVILFLGRAFSSGAVAITGISTINNSTKFFSSPKKRNAAQTLMTLGAISAVLLISIMFLVKKTGAVVVQDPEIFLRINGNPVPENYMQEPLLLQLASTVFGSGLITALLALATVGVLMVAAVTSFVGFPVLTSTIAEHRYLPMQLNSNASPRLYGNAMIILAAQAIMLILIFGIDVNSLIQLYIVGAFTSMSLTQSAVGWHRYKQLRLTLNKFKRRKLIRDLAVTCLGLIVTVLALTIVLLTKLTQGAWITFLVILATVGIMIMTRKHYDRIDQDVFLATDQASLAQARALPARVHAIVLVPRLRKPATRAIAYARATRPATIEAVTVNIVEGRTQEIMKNWEELGLPVPLTVLDGPHRDPVKPFVKYVRQQMSTSPLDVTVVYLPEYVVNHWWEKLLHRRVINKITAQLRREPRIVLATVPWVIGANGPASPAREDALHASRA